MKKALMSAIAAGVVLLPAVAQNYKVVVTTTDGEKTEFETKNISDIRFENAPNYAPLEYFIGGSYTSKGELGIYSFTLTSDQPDQWGYPPEVGDAELTLELIGAASESYLNAELPEGTYRPGTGQAAGEFDIQKSALILRLAEGEEGANIYPIIDGTVDVRRNDDNYVIKAELILLQGGTVALVYEGPLKFSPGMTEAEQFSEDQEFTFTGAQGRFFNNWFYPFVTDASLQFYSGEFDANGNQIEGYWLEIPVFMPKLLSVPDGTPTLTDGVYNAEPRDIIQNCTNIPYTYTRGYTLDFWGTLYPAGTYLNLREKSGRLFRGYIAEGTMTVSDNGTNIVFDFVTDYGKKVKATFKGKIDLKDYTDPADKIPDYSSTLTEDVKLDFIKGSEAASFNLGDYIKKGLNQFMVMVAEPEQKKGDYIMLELSAESDELPDGEYTINNALEPFTGIEGAIDYGGALLYSWYGDLDSTDEEGYQSVLAPIMGGTVTVTTVAEGERKLVFDLSDGKGHTITGEYIGVLYDISYSSAKPALKVARKVAK